MLQRISLDRVPHQVDACYPADNQEIFTRLRHAALFHDVVNVRERPVNAGGAVLQAAAFGVEAQPLSHSVPTIGYRLVEEDGRRMLPAKLAAFGVTGPDVGRLQRAGRLATAAGMVRVEQVSEPRRGQRFAFIMDTRLCDAAFALAEGADMVVCEATFADTEGALAREYGHLTAGQAGRIAAESRARLLVLTHFSQRYGREDGQRLAGQAEAAFGGQVVLARDLDRIPVPARHSTAQ